MQKTIALQSALKTTQDRAHNKFKKLSLITFLLLRIINQHSMPRSFFNCSPHQWIDVIEFLLLVARSSLEWEVRDSNLRPVKLLRHFFEGSCVAQAQ